MGIHNKDTIEIDTLKFQTMKNRIEFLEEQKEKLAQQRKDILDTLDDIYDDCYINCMKCDSSWGDYECDPLDPRVQFYKMKNLIADLLERDRHVIYIREGDDYE